MERPAPRRPALIERISEEEVEQASEVLEINFPDKSPEDILELLAKLVVRELQKIKED